MSHQVLCEPSIVSSTKYCLCHCQVWSNKMSSIMCAPGSITALARSYYHIIIYKVLSPRCVERMSRMWLLQVHLSGSQHTCSWNFQVRRGACLQLLWRSWSAFREHLKGNWSWIVGAWNWHNSIVCLIQWKTFFCGVCVSNFKHTQSVKIRREGGLNRC